MRKVSKALATLLAVCLLFTGAMTIFADSTSPVPSSSYKRPDMSINKMKSDITLDGELEAAWKNEATKIEFTKSALQSSGILWKYTDDDGETWGPDTPNGDGEGTAYVGWNENYFLFALEVKDSENTNEQVVNSELWMGDCLQMQIGASTDGFVGEDAENSKVQRHEIGFALSSAKGRPMGYEWFPGSQDLPAAKKQAASAVAAGKIGYFVKHSGTTTTYEVALHREAFDHTAALSKGDVIPFSFSLHLYKSAAEALGENDNGWFLEWAHGVVGGDTADLTKDDPYFGVKNIGSAARLTLWEGSAPPPTSTTTTTKKTPDTTTSKGDDKTTAPNGGNDDPTQPNPDNPDQPAATTEAPTTTTAPDMGDDVEDYKEENATDIDDANVLGAIKSQMDTDEVKIPDGNTMVVKSYVPSKAKLAVPMSEQNGVEALYVKDGDAYKKLSGEAAKDADGNEIAGWYVFDVSGLEEGAAIYVVKSLAPTTTVTTTTKAATTTKQQAGVTTTKAEETKGGSSWWIWLIVVLAVLIVAGVIVFFVLKKKNENVDNDDTDDTDGIDGDNGSSSEE